MNDNRLMIRLIDVALLVLLGFIAISRLKTEYIELPTAGNPERQMQDTHAASLHVYSSYYELEDAGRRQRIADLQRLENILVSSNMRYRQQRTKLIMNIEPHKASIMQNLIDVMDICQRNNIEKNLDYDSIN